MSPMSRCAIAAPSAAASRWPIRRRKCRPAWWPWARRSSCKAPAGKREIAADEYFKGLYETARQPNEILVEVLVPVQRPNAVSVFMELARRHGDFAIAGIAGHLTFDRDIVTEARLVYFGSEDRPTLAGGAGAALQGKRLDTATRDAAAAALTHDLQPMSNPQGSAKLRLELQRVLTRRALDTVLQRVRAAA